MKLSWIIWFLPPTSLWGCPWQKQHASSFAAFAAFAAAFGFRTCSTTARTLPWIRGEGFCRTCCKWEASTFIAIAVFHPFFMCFFPQGGLVPSGFTLYLQVFRLEQVADFDGQVQRLNDSTCVFFWDGSQGLSFEKRQVPGQLHGSDQAGFLLFLCLKKWHFVERNVRSKPNGPSSSRCRQADGVLVAFFSLPGLFASSCQVEAWWWWANWDFQEDFLDSSSRCQEGRLSNLSN